MTAGSRRGTAAIGWLFLLSAGASVGLAVVYARGGHTQLEGTLGAVALGALGAGLVRWAHRLAPREPVVEEREPLGSRARERLAAAQGFTAGTESLGRRTFLRRALATAVVALGAVAVFPIRSLGPRPGRSLHRTAWRPGARLVTRDGRPVGVRDLPVGGTAVVWPEGATDAQDAQVVLIRLAPHDLRPLPGREQWTPDGYVAFSRVCTHAGCPVGQYHVRTRRLFCPCHQSAFDVLRHAEPIAGPATRPLPQLPLQVDGRGVLRARDDFDQPVGPMFWRRDA